MYLACTYCVPAIYLGPPFRRSRPSRGGGPLTVACTRGTGLEAAGAQSCPCRTTAPAPGWRQVPLVFSAWDSATRNAATAVVNSGASTPPAPPAPAR